MRCPLYATMPARSVRARVVRSALQARTIGQTHRYAHPWVYDCLVRGVWGLPTLAHFEGIYHRCRTPVKATGVVVDRRRGMRFYPAGGIHAPLRRFGRCTHLTPSGLPGRTVARRCALRGRPAGAVLRGGFRASGRPAGAVIRGVSDCAFSQFHSCDITPI